MRAIDIESYREFARTAGSKALRLVAIGTGLFIDEENLRIPSIPVLCG
jgi:hypothetical protein